MRCSYQSNSIFDTGWSYRAICLLRFVKGQAGAEIAKMQHTLHCDTECIPSRGTTKHSVLYETKNKRPPVQKNSPLNQVSSCSTSGRGAIRDAAFASASPATLSRLPDRVLFEILRQKLSCNEFPALQSEFQLQYRSYLRYRIASISKFIEVYFDIEVFSISKCFDIEV
jgi:hypothetical protein